MFDETTREYVCPVCGRRFPERYKVKNPGPKWWNDHKEYGTRQLMALHAHNNFRKHTRACQRKATAEQAAEAARKDGAE